MSTQRPGGGRPLVFGHRGASADAPENTMASFTLAMEQGADGVELDVWRCGSGEVVVHHDADTRRTAGPALRISRATLAALRQLDVGTWKSPRFRGERIPLLAEVLRAVPAAVVNVELKSTGLPDLALPGAVARAIREARAEERCIVSSFDYLMLATFRLTAPDIASGILFAADRRWQLRESVGTTLLRPLAVHPQASLVDPPRMRRWADRALQVNVWTVDDPAEMDRVAQLGVSAVITNRPELARQVLQRSR